MLTERSNQKKTIILKKIDCDCTAFSLIYLGGFHKQKMTGEFKNVCAQIIFYVLNCKDMMGFWESSL